MMYKVEYYQDSQSGREPAYDYVEGLPEKEKAKVIAFIVMLAGRGGYLDEPYARKVVGTKFRELVVDFGKNTHHRVFCFTTRGQTIVLLHGFLKKTRKTPPDEIERGTLNYRDYMAYNF